MNYLFICFGADQDYYIQTKYAILSLLAFAPQQSSVYVLTDHGERFAHFDSVVTVLPLTDKQKKNWSNEIDSLYATKLFSMHYVSELVSGDLIYLDTDSIVHKPLLPLIQNVTDASALMYQREYLLKTQTKPVKLMLHKMLNSLGMMDLSKKSHYMASATLNKQWSHRYVGSEQAIWNSGVVGLSHDNKCLLEEAIHVYQALYAANIRNRSTEQLAISISLNQVDKLTEAIPYVYHYWHDKKRATQLIGQRLNQFQQQRLSMDAMVDLVRAQPLPENLAILPNSWQ